MYTERLEPVQVTICMLRCLSLLSQSFISAMHKDTHANHIENVLCACWLYITTWISLSDTFLYTTKDTLVIFINFLVWNVYQSSLIWRRAETRRKLTVLVVKYKYSGRTTQYHGCWCLLPRLTDIQCYHTKFASISDQNSDGLLYCSLFPSVVSSIFY